MASVAPFRVWKVGKEWKWEPGEKERRADHLDSLPDGSWEMPACQRPKRSTRANAYYRGVVLPMLADGNCTDDQMHDYMCEMFLPQERKHIEFFNRMTGEQVAFDIDTRRSSKLTGADFYDFVERVRLWGVEFLGIQTPDPDADFWRKRLRRRELPASPELHS